MSRDGGVPRAARAAALDAAGDLAREQADYRQAAAMHQEALALGRAMGDKQSVANSLVQFANLAIIRMDYEQATDVCTQALQLGDAWAVAQALIVLGFVARERGDQQRAAALFSESLTLRRDVGDKRGIAQCLLSLGNLALDQADYERASALYSDAMAVLREVDDRLFIALTLNNLGVTMLHQGQPERAAALHVESLRVCRETGDKRVLTFCLEALAAVGSAQGQPERAARLFGAAEALRDAIGLPPEPALRAAQAYGRSITDVRTQLGEAGFAAALAEGRAMPLDQITQYAMQPAACPPTTTWLEGRSC